MSYPRELGEYSAAELLGEILRRRAAQALGRCDYCDQRGTAPPCRFPERHAAAARGVNQSLTVLPDPAAGHLRGTPEGDSA